ncbi:MAG: glycosyl transferase family 1, partial [Anaerolineae bacterium]|nr:glycosyl transferase family 1 [Anaerolineae bacterium]
MEVISFRRQYPRWLFPGRSDADTSEKPLVVERVRYDIDPLDPISWWQTARRLRATAPDLLVMQWWVTFWAPSFVGLLSLYRRWLPGSPVVVLCHNVLPHETRCWDRLLARAVLSLGTHHVVHSAHDRTRLLHLVPSARVTTVRFPGYGEVIAGGCSKAEARCCLGLDPELPVLLFFGFVRPYKGLVYLLRAVDRVRRQFAVHLLIVGEFWESKDRYLRLIRELALDSC